LIPLVAETEITAQFQCFHPIANLDFAGGTGTHFFGGLGADFFGLLLGKDTFSHKGIKQRLIAFRLRVRGHICRR
jgi:ammonia channel protein AmtB